MTKLLKIAIISLAVLAGASTVQAGETTSSEWTSADQYFDQFETAGWG